MSEKRSMPRAETEPGIATAEDGFVLLDGPDGVALTMTPAAAAQTGRNLIAAAEQAAQQPAGNE
jgi:hypothetical protein